MAHLLAEFAPRDPSIDVAAMVPALLRAARALGLAGTVEIVGASRDDDMPTLEPEQTNFKHQFSLMAIEPLRAIASERVRASGPDELTHAKKELARREMEAAK